LAFFFGVRSPILGLGFVVFDFLFAVIVPPTLRVERAQLVLENKCRSRRRLQLGDNRVMNPSRSKSGGSPLN
jgi:hypothetical protein